MDQRSLAGYCPRGHKELDTAQCLTLLLSLGLWEYSEKVTDPKRSWCVVLGLSIETEPLG